VAAALGLVLAAQPTAVGALMRCFVHEDVEAVGICRACGRGLCVACADDGVGGLACHGSCAVGVRAAGAKVRERLKFRRAAAKREASRAAAAAMRAAQPRRGYGWRPFFVPAVVLLLLLAAWPLLVTRGDVRMAWAIGEGLTLLVIAGGVRLWQAMAGWERRVER
jgi:hypothetical protein